MDNYFTLYGLNETFHPDPIVVRKQYYAVSRQYHPDHFATASPAQQLEALQRTSVNNEAYKTLSDRDRTMAYILKWHGLLEEEEKYRLPPHFLMEMMELNELVEEWENSPADEALRQSAEKALQEGLEQWEEAVRPLTDRFDAGDVREEVLTQIRDAYMRRRYLLRIQERMDTFGARFAD